MRMYAFRQLPEEGGREGGREERKANPPMQIRIDHFQVRESDGRAEQMLQQGERQS